MQAWYEWSRYHHTTACAQDHPKTPFPAYLHAGLRNAMVVLVRLAMMVGNVWCVAMLPSGRPHAAALTTAFYFSARHGRMGFMFICAKAVAYGKVGAIAVVAGGCWWDVVAGCRYVKLR